MIDLTRPPRRNRSAPSKLDAFEIVRFRGLKDIRLENLGQINLLVGSNNAGKTSVLEALAIAENAFDPNEWLTVARAREGRPLSLFSHSQMNSLESLRWMFPTRQNDPWGELPPYSIELSSEACGERDRLFMACEPFRGIIPDDEIQRIVGHLRSRPKNEVIEDTGLLLRVSAELERGMAGVQHFSQEWPIWSRLGLRSTVRGPSRVGNCVFVAPYGHRNSPANLRRLTELSKLGERDDINDLLRELDPKIEGVEIVTSEDGSTPKIAVRMSNGSFVPQGVLGDGIRRALSIALALRTAAGGLLLIDEIEAALHVSALDRMFKWLEEAATSLSVQVFATTHSLEAIDSIVRSANPSKHDQLSAYMLDSDQPSGVKRYTGRMLHRLVVQRGLDIRG